MARLPYVDPSTAPEPVREALGAVPEPLGLFRMIAHASSAFEPWLRYGGALLAQLELSPLLRELAILQVAKLCGSEYEWVQHVPIAGVIGASDEQIAAIESGEDESSAFDADQTAVLRFTRAALTEGAASESDVNDLSERLGPRQVVELLLVIGQYAAIARLIATLGIEVDPPIDLSALRAAEEASPE